MRPSSLPLRDVTYDIAAGAWCAMHGVSQLALERGALTLWCTAVREASAGDEGLLALAGVALFSGGGTDRGVGAAATSYDHAAGDEARRAGLRLDMLQQHEAHALLEAARRPEDVAKHLASLKAFLGRGTPMPAVTRGDTRRPGRRQSSRATAG